MISDTVYRFLDTNADSVLSLIYERAMNGDAASLKMLFDATVNAAKNEGSQESDSEVLEDVLRRIYGDSTTVSKTVDQ
jgi:hypothetical protein